MSDAQIVDSGGLNPPESTETTTSIGSTGMAAVTPAGALGPRRAWRRWRRTRPFWGGLLIVLGAVEILLAELAPLSAIVHLGAEGLAGYFVPVVMLLCGVLLWFSPQQRTFYAILALVMSLASWITANLGGFFLGMLLGLVGGSLALAWAPHPTHGGSTTARNS
jgi:hypothetical protein